MIDADEGQLVDRARAGDLGAFELLVSPLIEPACHLAYTILRDWHQAEDAAQEAALKAWRAAPRLRAGTTSIRPWFLTIVANEARSRRCGRWWSVVRVNERLILLLHFHLDLPLEEVARVTGLSAVVVKARLYRATRRLRPAMRYVEMR